MVDNQPETLVCSKVFHNREFGFLKITVERPLRLNFQASPERIERLWEQRAFQNLATSKKRKDAKAAQTEIAAGEALQKDIIQVLEYLDGEPLYKERPKLLKVLNAAFDQADIKLTAALKKAVLAALIEPDPTAEICTDKHGAPEPDSDLRGTEIVPLPDDIELPLPLGYDGETGHNDLLALVQDHCEA